jgi:hypothetical protein
MKQNKQTNKKKKVFAEAINMLMYLRNTKRKQNCGGGISWNVVLQKTELDMDNG